MTQTIPTGQAAAPGRRVSNREYFEDMELPDMSAANIAPAVCYLLSDHAWNVNGQIFHVASGQIGVLPYLYPPAKRINKDIKRYGRWTQAELQELVHPMLISGNRNMAPPPPDLDLPGRPAEVATA